MVGPIQLPCMGCRGPPKVKTDTQSKPLLRMSAFTIGIAVKKKIEVSGVCILVAIVNDVALVMGNLGFELDILTGCGCLP